MLLFMLLLVTLLGFGGLGGNAAKEREKKEVDYNSLKTWLYITWNYTLLHEWEKKKKKRKKSHKIVFSATNNL